MTTSISSEAQRFMDEQMDKVGLILNIIDQLLFQNKEGICNKSRNL